MQVKIHDGCIHKMIKRYNVTMNKTGFPVGTNFLIALYTTILTAVGNGNKFTVVH